MIFHRKLILEISLFDFILCIGAYFIFIFQHYRFKIFYLCVYLLRFVLVLSDSDMLFEQMTLSIASNMERKNDIVRAYKLFSTPDPYYLKTDTALSNEVKLKKITYWKT